MHKHFNRFMRFWLVFTYFILFIPIFVVVLMSFNSSPYGTFPIHFTLNWYVMLFSKSDLFPATWLSLTFSLWVALLATAVGFLTAMGMRKLSKKRAGVFLSVMTLPVIVPWLVLGTALLMVFNFVGLGRSYLGMYLGNFIVVLPYVVFLVYGRLAQADISPEEAAKTLGAKPLRVMWDVTLPMASPAILSGGLMAYIVCFNNFVMQYYLAPFGVRTLPLEIYNMVRVGYKPDMNALASLIILFSIVLVLILYRVGFSAKSLVGK